MCLCKLQTANWLQFVLQTASTRNFSEMAAPESANCKLLSALDFPAFWWSANHTICKLQTDLDSTNTAQTGLAICKLNTMCQFLCKLLARLSHNLQSANCHAVCAQSASTRPLSQTARQFALDRGSLHGCFSSNSAQIELVGRF